MYKVVEIRLGSPSELQEYLNEQHLIEGRNLKNITYIGGGWYTIIFWDSNSKEQKQYIFDYAKANLCKDCLTCAAFGYFCRGSKEKCESWEYDEHAFRRIDHVYE